MTRRIQQYIENSPPWIAEMGVWAAIVAVSLLITFPLVLHLGDRIPGWPGDNLYFLWEFWWFKRALLDLHISPFINYDFYYPIGSELARDEMTPANTVLGLPLTVLFGPTVSYNVLMLSSFVISGYAVYRLIFEATGNRAAALMGGLAFAVLPYRFARFLGHPNLIATQWLALTLLFLERMFRSRRALDGMIAGIWFGLNALAAWYYLYIGTIAVMIFVSVRSWPWRETWRDRRVVYGAFGFALLGGLLLIPFALPYLQLQESGVLQQPLFEQDAWSANLTDFIQPNPLHPIWGEAIRQIFPFQWKMYVEHTLSLSWVLLLLAVVGAWSRRHDRTVQALTILAVVTFSLALGPTLHWNGSRIEYPLPARIVRWAEQAGLIANLGHWFDPSLANLVRAGRGFIPLPAMFMYALVPLASSTRAILRFGIVASLATVILAGFGTAAWVQRMQNRRWMRTMGPLVLCALVLFESWSVIPNDAPQWTAIQARPVDEWLAAQPGPSVLVEFPLIQNVHPTEMLYQTVNHQRLVFGGLPTSFKPAVLFDRANRLESFPSAEALAALREWNTRYILVTPSQFKESDWPPFQSKLAALGQVRCVNELDGVLVYDIQ